MNPGHTMKLPQGGEIEVRRCWTSEVDGATDAECVCFTVETLVPYWSLLSFPLTQQQSFELGSALIAEGLKKMEDYVG